VFGNHGGESSLAILKVINLARHQNNPEIGDTRQDIVPVTKGMVESQETSPESPIQKSPSGINVGASTCISADHP